MKDLKTIPTEDDLTIYVLSRMKFIRLPQLLMTVLFLCPNIVSIFCTSRQYIYGKMYFRMCNEVIGWSHLYFNLIPFPKHSKIYNITTRNSYSNVEYIYIAMATGFKVFDILF